MNITQSTQDALWKKFRDDLSHGDPPREAFERATRDAWNLAVEYSPGYSIEKRMHDTIERADLVEFMARNAEARALELQTFTGALKALWRSICRREPVIVYSRRLHPVAPEPPSGSHVTHG